MSRTYLIEGDTLVSLGGSTSLPVMESPKEWIVVLDVTLQNRMLEEERGDCVYDLIY